MYVLLAACLLCILVSPAFAADETLRPANLRVEYRAAPQGINEERPRFTWQLLCGRRGCAQTAWQLQVADTPENIETTNVFWDSGKVQDGTPVLRPYDGPPLRPRMRYWWRVRVWDEDDVMSEWSPTAHFSTGLPEDDGWRAQWIGHDVEDAADIEAADAAPPEKAHWIWHPDAPSRETALFRRVVALPDDALIVNAPLMVTADDSVRVWINGRRVGVGQPEMRNWRTVNYHLVAALLRPGRNILALEATGKRGVAGVMATLRISLRDGTVLDVVTDNTWKTSPALADDSWRHPDYDDTNWTHATAHAAFGEAPWNESRLETARFKPVAHLRHTFTPRNDIRRATLYATALGIYEMRLNGERVGDYYFAPGWTDYRERVYYHSYDVTDLLRPGAENALGALLAHGWYAGHLSLHGPEIYGTRPRLMAQLEIEYADGQRETVLTDGSWRAAHGAIRGADFQMGETRDFHRAVTGWDQPGYDDDAWTPASTTPPEIVPRRVQAHPGPPVKHCETIAARSVSEPRPGVYVYDFGQNMVGWTRITLAGHPGQRIRIRHAEMLEEDGMLYTDALRRATATNVYHLAEAEEITLEPAFTFHGFRYVELRGVDAPPPLESVAGIVLRSEAPITTAFACSEPLLNQLVSNIEWGLKGNYLEIPTDCPQRDERLGWTGDAQFFMPTALYMADVGAFFTKWFVDLIQDSQAEDGSFAHVAPDIGLGGGATAWGDAAILCPWLFYQYYGDTRIIERHFDNMVRGMEFLASKSDNYTSSSIGFGDWLNLGGGAKNEVIFTAYYAHLAGLMANMAAVIGRSDQAKEYADLRDNIRDAFVAMFIDEDGRILESSQTGYALAFAFELIPQHLREEAAQRFVEEIERFDGHLATGFIGTPRLLPALTQAGRDDIAWGLLMNTSYPSWLYQVTLGATTTWERWNGWTPEEGFGDPNMNSFNHYAFGAVGEWIFNRVVGIFPGEPGFKTVRIAPTPGGGLSWARMTYQSIRGPISAAWRIEDNVFHLDVTVPPGVKAIVQLPTSDPASVNESGNTLDDAGITLLDTANNLLCEIASGTYAFKVTAPALNDLL